MRSALFPILLSSLLLPYNGIELELRFTSNRLYYNTNYFEYLINKSDRQKICSNTKERIRKSRPKTTFLIVARHRLTSRLQTLISSAVHIQHHKQLAKNTNCLLISLLFLLQNTPTLCRHHVWTIKILYIWKKNTYS